MKAYNSNHHRLPQDPLSRHRRNTARLVLALTASIPVGAGVMDFSQGTERVTVQYGDNGADVVCRGQEQIAKKNPHVDPADSGCIAGGQKLDVETGGLRAGDTVQVEVMQNGYHGNQSATGLNMGRVSQNK